MLYLVTGITDNYYERAKPYLQSMNEKSNVKNIVIYLSASGKKRVKDVYKNIEFVYGKIDKQRFPNVNNCMQHGEWLTYLDKRVKDSDVVMFTDADMIMQDSLEEDFITNVEAIEDNEVLTSYNASENDKLSDEFLRLQPIKSINEICDELKQVFNIDIQDVNCFNTGVICCNVTTWKNLYMIYTKIYDLIKGSFNNYASQQWFISLILGHFFKPYVLDYSIHTHGHYDLPDYVTEKEDDPNVAQYNGKTIVFRHHF